MIASPSALTAARSRIALDRVSYWQGVGAQMSPAVARLVKDFAKKHGQVQAPAAPAAA